MEQINYGEMGLRARVHQLSQAPMGKMVLLGATAIVLTPLVLPLVKPVIKSTLKIGFSWFEKTKTALAETGEILADIAAEAKAESLGDAQKKVIQLSSSPRD